MSKNKAKVLIISFFLLTNIAIVSSAAVSNPPHHSDLAEETVKQINPNALNCEEEGQTLRCELKENNISFDIDEGEYTVIYLKEIIYDKDFSNVLEKDLPLLLNIYVYNNASKQLLPYEGEGKLISYSKSEFEFVIDVPNGEQKVLPFTVLYDNIDNNRVVIVETLQKKSIKINRIFALSLINTILLLVVLKVVSDFIPEDRNL